MLSGTAKAIVAYAVLLVLPLALGESLPVTRTAAFLFLAAGQLLFTYPARQTDLRPAPNAMVHAAVVLGFLSQVAVVQLPALMRAFDTVALPASVWLVVAASIALSWGLAELASRVIWWHSVTRPGSRRVSFPSELE